MIIYQSYLLTYFVLLI